ncbi:MAG: transcription elongation factor GreA [Candidatus Peregrinibacteria bacterium]|nr:transcription elongation factor GreA [Candidatus Peregrinibacteria bacterium]
MAKITKKSTKSSSSVDGSAPSEPKIFILTKEGYDKLVTELDYLKNVKRREVAERIREAISYGDLSENSEYEDSKNEQAFVEGRILELEEKVKYVQIIEDHKKTASVQLGSTVKIKNTKTKVETEFAVVGSTEADPLKGKISNVSPVGSALLDRHVGEVVSVHAPSGLIEYEIMKVQ